MGKNFLNDEKNGKIKFQTVFKEKILHINKKYFGLENQFFYGFS